MPADRYVTLGLARVRTPWFSDVARWSTSGSLAMDFVKTVSADEVRSQLASGRPFSALLVDGGLTGIDRDLLESAVEQGCAPIVVADGATRDWRAIGAVAVLSTDFDCVELEAVLVDHARPIGRADDVPAQVEAARIVPGFRARTVAVTGPGGTGRSVVAAAIAQGFGADVAHTDTVVLADLALHADQAVLHDARDVIPGVLELVEAHRAGMPTADEVRSLTFDVAARRYRLLLGLRRHRDWTALRPRALRVALDGLRQAFTLVVADIDDDFEGEDLTGSADVEDRNLLARSTLSIADVVVVVGAPGVKGMHSLLRVLRDVIASGVDPGRVVPVMNRVPRRASMRSELARTVTELLVASNPGDALLSPIFLPERKQIDEAIRDGVGLPTALVDPVTAAVRARLGAVDDRAPAVGFDDAPVPVEIGSLGTWHEEVAG
ncbi:MAG: hypothetical protein ACSLFO_03580 [Acidimicrobiales bacterium]